MSATVDPVVVVGFGLAVAGASSPTEFWDLLHDGPLGFPEPEPDRWSAAAFAGERRAVDKAYQTRAGFMRGFTPHPALLAEEERGEVSTDTGVRWLRHSLYQALDGVRRRSGDRFAFCVGATPDGSQTLEEALVHGAVDAELNGALGQFLEPDRRERLRTALRERYLPAGNEPVLAPRRMVADSCRGVLPAETDIVLLDTACSSSLYTIDQGVRKLLSDDSDIAVCGGVFGLSPSNAVLFSKINGFSPSGAIRAFDETADGTLFAEGAGLVVLKRLSRAIADNDVVHGVIAGVSLGADGKGRAIYAPVSEQQTRAMRLVLARSGVTPAEVGYIVAHATGTKGGDAAEFAALKECYRADQPIPVAANKSVIGHTGWAAGAMSVIHMLLAMRHGVIPPQHAFETAPESFGLEDSNLLIPRESRAWPPGPDGAPRVGAVCGFGFGGTNAHLLVREYRAGQPGSSAWPQPSEEPLVVVGWSAKMPEATTPEELAVWAAGDDAGPARTFGAHYPPPSLDELFLVPAMVGHLDRTQLMLADCVRRLDPAVWAACERHHERAGVVVGHTGPTGQALSAHLRLYADDVEATLLAADDTLATREVVTGLRKAIDDLAPPASQHTYPGVMPNIIASRLSNYYDLRGLNVTVDDGDASLLTAFDVAGSYLRFGDLDVALVAAAVGNGRPEWLTLLEDERPGITENGVVESGFVFVVTTLSFAQREDLPVLAEWSVA